MQNKTCAIIGAGIAGLAAAVRLAQKGYQVTVFEANTYFGGKLSEINISSNKGENYRFDAGPSLFTMPHFVDELFVLAGKNPRDYLQYERLDVVCKYFYEDSTIINAFADKNAFAQEIETKTSEKKENVLHFLEKSAEKYDLTADLFLHSSLHKLKTYFSLKTLKGILGIRKLEVFRTMNEANQASFSDKRVVQLFNRFATYNGSNPYQTPATLNIIPHLEHNIGAFAPKGGMYAISKSIFRLAQELGVKFCFSSKVKEIIIKDKKAVGICLTTPNPSLESRGTTLTTHNRSLESRGTILTTPNSLEKSRGTSLPSFEGGAGGGFSEILPFDVVVSNMDIVGTYNHLLPNENAPQKLLNQPKSSSALIFYWGIKESFPELEVHNIFFAQDYEREFKHIFEDKNVAEDVTVYVNIGSKYASEDCPQGHETWFVMVNTPNNTGQDWDAITKEVRKNVLKKLSKILKKDIESLITCESTLDARTIENRTSSSLGALYGNSSNNRYAAFLRHANFSSKIENLYFCGGSVHPGGGIPLCLSSAKIVAEML